MSLEQRLDAIRRGVVLTQMHHVHVMRVSGEEAFTLVDAITPRPLFLRDGQALHSLLLDQDGHVAADLYVCADDLDYLLIAEGLTGEALIAWLRAHGPPDLDVQLTDLDADHRVLSLDGPYALELMGDLVGPEVIGPLVDAKGGVGGAGGGLQVRVGISALGAC